jgi:ActR/RegA family two-component response regulator
MPAAEIMDIDERYKYLRRMQKRHTQGSRSERDDLLDEMARHTGLHRKSLIRLLTAHL